MMENISMDTSPANAMELNIPDFDRIYHSAPETNRPSVIKSRKKYTYDINNNKNICTEVNNNSRSIDTKINCNCQSFDNGTTTLSSHSENWYVPGIRNMSNNYNKNFPINYTYENSFFNNAPIMAASSSGFLYNNNNNNENRKMNESNRNISISNHRSIKNFDRRDSIDSLPPLEEAQETVKVQVGIDDDLQMILDLDPSIVDLGSTPTITITDQTVTGLPPISGG